MSVKVYSFLLQVFIVHNLHGFIIYCLVKTGYEMHKDFSVKWAEEVEWQRVPPTHHRCQQEEASILSIHLLSNRYHPCKCYRHQDQIYTYWGKACHAWTDAVQEVWRGSEYKTWPGLCPQVSTNCVPWPGYQGGCNWTTVLALEKFTSHRRQSIKPTCRKSPHEAGCNQEVNWEAQTLIALKLQRRKRKSCVDRNRQAGSWRGPWKEG